MWTLRILWTLVGFALICVQAQVAPDNCDLIQTGSSEMVITIKESTTVGSVIGEIQPHGSSVRLRPYLNPTLGFNTTTREVVLLTEVDNDDGSKVPPLKILCTENGTTDDRGINITVRLGVNDVNDNAPEFNSKNHTVSVPEDTPVGNTIFSGAVATDKDRSTWSNGLVVYSLKAGNSSEYFDLSKSSQNDPSIILSKELDYESVKEYTILLLAMDKPSNISDRMTATATITIKVEDSDDQKPEFTHKSYTGEISANASKGTLVRVSPKIKAKDPDSMNVPITYKIIDPYELFGVNNETAEVYNIRNFYEKLSTVTVVIMAQQSINTEQERFAILTISISKANTNAPRFSQQVYQVTRNELASVGSDLLTAIATDEDESNVLTYDIVGDNSNFSINERGLLKLMTPLDYETEKLHVIKITVSDGTYTATATVSLHVEDVNDNNPRILNTETKVVRQREDGQLITIIDASDADTDNTLQYGLRTHDDLFTISGDGELYVTANPERLLRDDYEILVVVSDNGTPPREASTLITVIFPPRGYTTPRPTVPAPAASVAKEASDMLTIILGAVCGVLLIVIVVLIIYVLWRNKRTKEELDKARVPSVYGAKGLTYRQADSPDDLPKIDLHYADDTDATSVFDGGTTVQENPLKSTAVNKGYMQSSGSEMDRDLNEIEVETAVVPYDEDDDFGYPSTKPKYNGNLRTFHVDDTTSSGSNQSDSTSGSRRILVNDENKDGGGKMTSWDSDDKLHPQGAQKLVDSAASTGTFKDKKTDKPQLTVYF